MRCLPQSILMLTLISVSCLPLSIFAEQNSEQEKSAELLHLTTEEQLYLQQKQWLTMCINPDAMPIGKIEKDQNIGMSADFMRLLANKINTPLVLIPTHSWSESLQLAEQRQCDILVLAMGIPQRKKFLDFNDHTVLIEVISALAMIILFFLYHYWQLRKYNYRLRHLSTTDKLTNINNRLELDQQLADAIHLAQRYQHSFSIILVDIDYFKNINDDYGHLIGDYAIKTLAQLLKNNIRTVDTLGRWGGEEFLIICPGQTIEGGHLLAEKLRKIVDQYQFDAFSHLSCSFGVAAYAQDSNADTLLKRADKALYRSKNQGRNQVFTN